MKAWVHTTKHSKFFYFSWGFIPKYSSEANLDYLKTAFAWGVCKNNNKNLEIQSQLGKSYLKWQNRI